jgi:hypothetical protein
MNFAVSRAQNDWVFCVDSDEFIDEKTISEIKSIALEDHTVGYRISRYWHVFGCEVHAIYPVSSPDYPVRLFNRRSCQFNGQPVDDKPVGFTSTAIIPGRVVHDTFYSLDEMFGKANTYTSRLVRNKIVKPSLLRALFSPIFAFLKWYFRKKAYKDGAIGLVTAGYAAIYSFQKYLKAWAGHHNIPHQHLRQLPHQLRHQRPQLNLMNYQPLDQGAKLRGRWLQTGV